MGGKMKEDSEEKFEDDDFFEELDLDEEEEF